MSVRRQPNRLLVISGPSRGNHSAMTWPMLSFSAMQGLSFDLCSDMSLSEKRHGRSGSLFGCHSVDCLFAGYPLVLSLSSDHLSVVSRLYSQPRVSAVLLAMRLGCPLGHASEPSLGRRRWFSAASFWLDFDCPSVVSWQPLGRVSSPLSNSLSGPCFSHISAVSRLASGPFRGHVSQSSLG